MDRLVGLPAIESLLCWDIKGNILPRLATAWEFSPDYKSITFTLRQGVKFHDGTDFNAEAAKYNLDIWRGASIPDLKSVSSVDIIDNYKIRLNISTYEPGFISSLCYQSGSMVSPTSLKTHDKEYNLMHAVGTGPFKQVSIDRNTGVKYERFNDYWQKGVDRQR